MTKGLANDWTPVEVGKDSEMEVCWVFSAEVCAPDRSGSEAGVVWGAFSSEGSVDKYKVSPLSLGASGIG
jgi:hypothetical protein